MAVLVIAVAFFAASPGPAASQETVGVAVGDIWFCNASFEEGVCTTVIDVGDTVVWDFSGALLPHTTTECGASCDAATSSPAWTSGIILGGGTFQFTFAEPGTYLYYCQVHPLLQRGRIVVQSGPPPATQPPIPTATPGDGPAATSTPAAIATAVGPPGTGVGPQEGSSGAWWAVALAAIGGALVMSGGWYARKPGARTEAGKHD